MERPDGVCGMAIFGEAMSRRQWRQFTFGVAFPAELFSTTGKYFCMSEEVFVIAGDATAFIVIARATGDEVIPSF